LKVGAEDPQWKVDAPRAQARYRARLAASCAELPSLARTGTADQRAGAQFLISTCTIVDNLASGDTQNPAGAAAKRTIVTAFAVGYLAAMRDTR
jgi:hypothetical protein